MEKIIVTLGGYCAVRKGGSALGSLSPARLSKGGLR